jgi:hypothetical protein
MGDIDYRLKIADFCRHAAIPEWEEVVRTQHIEVGGKTIGLIPDPGGDGRLSVYIDLGPVHIQRDPRMFEQMLIANMEARGPLSGAFCIYPDSGNAVYHMSLGAQVTGEEMARCLDDALRQIGSRFEELSHAAD